MRWDALFADLEGQLIAADQQVTDAEVAERVRIDVGGVSLADRLRWRIGERPPLPPLTWRLVGGEVIRGVPVAVGEDMCLVDAEAGRQVLLPLRAVAMVAGLGRHSRAEPSALLRRLGLRHAVRGLARERQPVRVVTVGAEVAGVIDRVGADHLDVGLRVVGEVDGGAGVVVVPLHAVVAIWSA